MNFVITTPEGDQSEYSFDADEIIIGRGQNCDIVISDDHVSRRHLQVKKFDGVILLKDLTLSNWVSYNDEKLEKGVDVQYFDFAPLMLPGNYRIKISDDELFDDAQVSKSSETGIDIFNSELAEYVDEDQASEETNLKKKKTGKGRKWKPAKSLKKRNDPAIMSVAILVVMALLIYQFFYKEDEQSASLDKLNNLEQKKTFEKRVIRRKTPVKQIQEAAPKKVTNLKNVKQTNFIKAEDPYLKIVSLENKCQTLQMQAMCKNLFPHLSKKEGLQRIQKIMYVVKNFTIQGTQLLRSRDNFKNTIIQQDLLKMIVAGEKVLLPNFLKMMELNGVSKVVIILFDMTRLQTQIVGKYQIDVADYRKYDQNKYTKAYSSIVGKQDTALFRTNIMNYIKEL